MSGFILGEKSKQTQYFLPDTTRIPVTLIKTSPCYLLEVKSAPGDRYAAALLGYGKARRVKISRAGVWKKAGVVTPLRYLREFRLDRLAQFSPIEENKKKGLIINNKKIFVGEEIKPAIFFQAGDRVQVTGTAKGKGFQGVVVRHHFKGGPHTHGQSDRERAPGSIGQTTTPGRVYKGKRMAGRMGGQRVTIKNLEVIAANEDGLLVKGVVPGSLGTLLKVQPPVK
ncbi:50S ribosomal protein L3 [Patescibacteria group bacterium]|nr:50S ribosomal protein L3 [Patescibacteria group bacterium]MCL5091669.1 50S ribosomal protein L3 [Patescibacteria group bacterium]